MKKLGLIQNTQFRNQLFQYLCFAKHPLKIIVFSVKQLILRIFILLLIPQKNRIILFLKYRIIADRDILQYFNIRLLRNKKHPFNH